MWQKMPILKERTIGAYGNGTLSVGLAGLTLSQVSRSVIEDQNVNHR